MTRKLSDLHYVHNQERTSLLPLKRLQITLFTFLRNLQFKWMLWSIDLRTIIAYKHERVRTKHGPGVHGPPLWTGSMDPLSWTRSMDSFFYFYKKVLHQVHGHSKTEIVPKKDLTRRCRPMLTIDHKYLVVLT